MSLHSRIQKVLPTHPQKLLQLCWVTANFPQLHLKPNKLTMKKLVKLLRG